MHFNSIDFLLFLTAAAAVHWLLPKRARAPWLLLASYAFYASWDKRWLGMLLGVTAVTYLAGRGVARSKDRAARGAWLAAAVAGTVGCLAAYKLGAAASGWIVPLGLSYYAFTGLGYVLDVHRGGAPARGPVEYALFLAFFPQIVSGPIERARRVLPQLESPASFDRARFSSGCFLLAWGLFQKVFVADNLAGLIDRLFDGRLQPEGAVSLLGLYAYAFQLYADFAGYSDAARGAARLVGVELVPNFDRPFLASDMRLFWKRWHMSLTSWFMDYLYRPILELPLPGKLWAAPFLTMLLMGLWHGVSPQMAAMGAYYGALLTATLWIQSRRDSDPPQAGPRAWLGVLLTFHAVAFGFMLMRAPDLAAAFDLLRGVGRGPFWGPDARLFAFWLAWFGWPVVLVHAAGAERAEVPALLRLPVLARAALYVAMFYAVMVFGNDETRDFIYLQF